MDLKTGLLLRQQVPQDKERITFNYLDEVDDVWIWLFNQMSFNLGLSHSEIWMWGGGPRTVLYREGLTEQWFHKFPTDLYHPDFIFSRGGFKQYIPIMQANPQAKTLYYGAIFKKRLNPKANQDPTNYDLILADSQEQYDLLVSEGFNVHKFFKPACENIFKPVDVAKQFDVLFMANAKQKFKGHEWFFNQMAGTNLSILQIGNTDPKLINLASKLNLNIHFAGWVPRKDIPELACKAKVGVVCSTGDSCPRVIPEMLAMNIPVIVRRNKGLSLWEDYANGSECILVSEQYFISAVKDYVKFYDVTSPNKFYFENFSIKKSAKKITDHLLSVSNNES